MSEGKVIVYMDESNITSNVTPNKAWAKRNGPN